jgi:hypothetical protein
MTPEQEIAPSAAHSVCTANLSPASFATEVQDIHHVFLCDSVYLGPEMMCAIILFRMREHRGEAHHLGGFFGEGATIFRRLFAQYAGSLLRNCPCFRWLHLAESRSLAGGLPIRRLMSLHSSQCNGVIFYPALVLLGFLPFGATDFQVRGAFLMGGNADGRISSGGPHRETIEVRL